jgi:2-polyprenyl-3-methyl-5-hydroxy-6-metoxy-1,4-benzoquinol methylase
MSRSASITARSTDVRVRDYIRGARALLRRIGGRGPEAPREAPERSVEVFDTASYADITVARLRHLESLGLPLRGCSVLDLGAGVGHFTGFFRSQGCSVHCVDARPDNIARLRALYPDVTATVMDLEQADLAGLGKFDVVLCYGLLYHLVDPAAALRKIATACDGMLLLETCIVDAAPPAVIWVPEDSQNPSQTLGRWGCRPSESFLGAVLRDSGYEYLYRPSRLPDHEQFRYERRGDYSHVRHGRLMRTIVVATRRPLVSMTLHPWDGLSL